MYNQYIPSEVSYEKVSEEEPESQALKKEKNIIDRNHIEIPLLKNTAAYSDEKNAGESSIFNTLPLLGLEDTLKFLLAIMFLKSEHRRTILALTLLFLRNAQCFKALV